MIVLRNTLYVTFFIAVTAVLVWVLAIPDDFIIVKIEDAVSDVKNPEMSVSVEGLSKGLLFSVYAKKIQLEIKGRPALNFTELTGRFNPIVIMGRKISFVLNGSMGTGSVNGSFSLPGGGNLRIDMADLDAIPLLKDLGNDIQGHVTADITVTGNTAEIIFEISDIHFVGSQVTWLPLFSSFHKIQGVLAIADDTIGVTSLGLEGEKGYARLKGEITGGLMNLNLELMPITNRLSSTELMLLKGYRKSPGFYVIPLKGRIF